MISLKKFFITYLFFFITLFIISIFFVNNLFEKSKLNEKNIDSINMPTSEYVPIIEVYTKHEYLMSNFQNDLIKKFDKHFEIINQKLLINSEKNLISDNLIKKYLNEIELFNKNLKSCFIKAYTCSDEKLKKIYLMEINKINNLIGLSSTQFVNYLNCLFTIKNLSNNYFCDEDYKKIFYEKYLKLNLELKFNIPSDSKKVVDTSDTSDPIYKVYVIIFVISILFSIIILSMPLTIFLTKHRFK